MKKIVIIVYLLVLKATAYGALAGGRPNAISGGQNAFAGVVNPANAVWIKDRIDVGGFLVHQNSSLTNHDDNPRFPPGKTDFTYRVKYIFSPDLGIHKQFLLKSGSKSYETSFSLATYTTPSIIKLRTKMALPVTGTTPLMIYDKVQGISSIFSFKVNPKNSLGISVDYFYFSHRRNGFQNSDNPLRSVSPGNVTNNGMDHSQGIGLSIGWHSKITKSLDFGAAWAKKSYCGQYRKYRGFEPHHAKNYIPQTFGAGFSYKFNKTLRGRIECLWSNLGDLPNANNNFLPDGSFNLNKRGSNKSPGSGLQDATYINMGLGYRVNTMLSIGTGWSHRIKLRPSSNFLSHSYRRQATYDLLSLGANFNYKKHDFFLSSSIGLKNKVSGHIPEIVAGGGRFSSSKQNVSISASWGYMY